MARAEHFEALGGGGAGGGVLVRGLAAGEEDDAVETGGAAGGAGDVEVAVVDGVEGAAEDREVHFGMCCWLFVICY